MRFFWFGDLVVAPRNSFFQNHRPPYFVHRAKNKNTKKKNTAFLSGLVDEKIRTHLWSVFHELVFSDLSWNLWSKTRGLSFRGDVKYGKMDLDFLEMRLMFLMFRCWLLLQNVYA